MLAVDLDQQLAQLAQLESGTAVPLIKPRERPSALITRRSKHSRPLSSWFSSSQRWAAGVSFSAKRAQVGTGGAATHHVGFRSAAEAQPQRVDGNGFPGAGFPGDGGHAAVEIDFQFTNDSKITDGELRQHSCLPV
jgi:hypothetical protein